MSFQCTIVTPEEQVFDQSINQAVIPAHDGKIGILTDRAPLLVKLGAGELRLDLSAGQSQTLFIDGGVAQMKDNKLTILTNQATRPEAINAETARAELAEATARRTTDDKSAQERERRINSARAKLEMAKS
jgi:F-type H+-transporting ATPase subunit epsilon